MYKFDPGNEPVEAAFKKIALSQLDEALGELSAAESNGRSVVHEARRRCKKLRGLLRLVRPAFPGFGAENRAIRDAAALLSHLRDTEVLRETIDELATHRPADAEPLGRIVQRLAAEPAPAAEAEKLETFRASLLAVRERVPDWSLSKTGLDAVLPGLRSTFRSDRRGMARARRTRLALDFHEWRKANKNHGFHVDLLKKLAPDVLADDLRGIERLSDLLGHHHDMSVLAHALDADPARFGDDSDLAVLRTALAARTAEIETGIFELARQVLAERPKHVAQRFARYWKSAT